MDKAFLLIASRIWFRDNDQEGVLVTSYPLSDGKSVVAYSILTRKREVLDLDELAKYTIGRHATAQDWRMAGVAQHEEGHYVDGDDLFCDLVDQVSVTDISDMRQTTPREEHQIFLVEGKFNPRCKSATI